MAGAFAGIAVCAALTGATHRLTTSSGAHRDVSSRLDEGKHFSCWSQVAGPLTCIAQTRMQIINPTSGGLYTGISNAASTIYRLEGLRTLWRGVSSVIVGAGEHKNLRTLEIHV